MVVEIKKMVEKMVVEIKTSENLSKNQFSREKNRASINKHGHEKTCENFFLTTAYLTHENCH